MSCVFSSSIRRQKFIMASPTNTPACSCSSPASTATATRSLFQTSMVSAAVSPPARSSTSASPVAAASQHRTFDLAMDLAMLRQIRSHDQPFCRGSPPIELVAAELANFDASQILCCYQKDDS